MQMVHQGYVEPHNATAIWDQEDRIRIWTSTQGAFPVRTQTAGILQMPESRLKVTPLEIGGGFGGKTHVWIEPLALALSRKANRPVKMVMTREEVFRGSGPTCATSMDIKIGATKDGKITGAQATVRYSAGPWPGMWGMLGAMTAWACYNIENVKAIGIDVEQYGGICSRVNIRADVGFAFATGCIVGQVNVNIQGVSDGVIARGDCVFDGDDITAAAATVSLDDTNDDGDDFGSMANPIGTRRKIRIRRAGNESSPIMRSLNGPPPVRAAAPYDRSRPRRSVWQPHKLKPRPP